MFAGFAVTMLFSGTQRYSGGGVSTVVQHRLEPPGHGLNQVVKVLAIVHLQGPQPFDLNLQLRVVSETFSWLLIFVKDTPAFLSSMAECFSSAEKVLPVMRKLLCVFCRNP